MPGCPPTQLVPLVGSLRETGGYAASASIVTGGIALASQAKGVAPAGASLGLIRALAALATAERVSARYQENVYEPTRLRWLAAKDAVPHVVIEPSPR